MKVKTALEKICSGLVFSALLTSCASIVSGTHQEIRVNSTPSGAVVKVDNAISGQTPTILTLSAKESHQVRIELAGYKPYEVALTQKTNGWIFGNIFFGGLIGIVVDMNTGAAYALTPNKIDAQLISAKCTGRVSHASYGDKQLLVTLVSKADPSWQRIGQLEKE